MGNRNTRRVLATIILGLSSSCALADTSTYTSVGTSTATDTSTNSSCPEAAGPWHNPDGSCGVINSFDWQANWGTIHLNSYADGLNDPPSPGGGNNQVADANGQVPCTTTIGGQPDGTTVTNLCMQLAQQDNVNPKPVQIENAIKYDIKNSLVNCLSVPMPNAAINNPWQSDQAVCTTANGLFPAKVHDYPVTGKIPNVATTVLYAPIWDARSNDSRAVASGGVVGCQQQISNNCAYDSQGDLTRDIYTCINAPANGAAHTSGPGPGYLHPVTHVFSKEELQQLGNPATVPAIYYSYTLKAGGTALTVNNPPTDPNWDGNAVTTINASWSASSSSTDLDVKQMNHLKAFQLFDATPALEDVSGFVIIDPSDFFNVALYAPGGKFDASYSKTDTVTMSDGSKPQMPSTYMTCPVFNMPGYAGICDPRGPNDPDYAGCNLPIYGIGAATTFTDANGNSSSYNHYPVKWSGYVKGWSIITQSHYNQNIAGKENFYLNGDDLNANPILMVERSSDYCDPIEMESVQDLSSPPSGKRVKPSSSQCIQYLQYQQLEDNSWTFVDLYYPVEEEFSAWSPVYDTLQVLNVDANGNAIPGSYVTGSGSDLYIGGSGSKTGYASFLDFQGSAAPHQDAMYYNQQLNPGSTTPTLQAVTKGAVQYVNVLGPNGLPTGKIIPTPGLPLGGNTKTGSYNNASVQVATNGTGISLPPGQATAIRLASGNSLTVPVNGKATPSTCVVVDALPNGKAAAGSSSAPQLFIPTSSTAEFQAFLNASGAPGGITGAGASINVRPCGGNFLMNNDPLAIANSGNDGSTGGMGTLQGPVKNTQTFVGTLSCSLLTQKPSCDQARRIAAQRFCQLESGDLADCSACDSANDPDLAMETMATSPYKASDAASGFSHADTGKEVLANPLDKSSRCFYLASCFDTMAQGCPAVATDGGHVFCLAPETNITMADGTEKPIKKVKAGDMVQSFNATQVRNGALGSAKVLETAVTKNQPIIKINDLKITPKHKIVLATGRSVEASEIKVGDKILRFNGTIEVVKTVKKNLKNITVYNLVLEDGKDGYIANGIRVMSYPILNGMEEKNAGAGGNVRHVSGLKSPR